MSLPALSGPVVFGQRDPATCYICGSGSGVCAACKREHLGQEGVDPTEVSGLVQSINEKLKSALASYVGQGENAGRSKEAQYTIQQDRVAVAKARADGMVIVQGQPRALLLDLDNEVSCARFRDAREMVEDKFGIQSVTAWHSKSGAPHVHAYVTIGTALSPMARNGLEVALGSDPKRGVFCVLKHEEYGIEEPSLLFQPRGAKLRLNWDGHPWWKD